MAEPKFSNVATADFDDDLPRTLRREHESRARQAREAAAATNKEPAGPVLAMEPPRPEPIDSIPSTNRADTIGSVHAPSDMIGAAPAIVTRLDVPFLHLSAFFLKAVIAAIPALILLLVLLWLAGEALTATFPDLVKMQILIRMPN